MIPNLLHHLSLSVCPKLPHGWHHSEMRHQQTSCLRSMSRHKTYYGNIQLCRERQHTNLSETSFSCTQNASLQMYCFLCYKSVKITRGFTWETHLIYTYWISSEMTFLSGWEAMCLESQGSLSTESCTHPLHTLLERGSMWGRLFNSCYPDPRPVDV